MAGVFTQSLNRRIATLSAVALLAFASCGSGSGNDATVSLAAIGDATAEAKSARVSTELVFEGSSVSMEGVFEFATGKSRITSRSTQDGTPSMTMIYTGADTYIGPAELPDTGPAWLRAPSQDSESATKDLDPAKFIEELRKSGAKLDESGTGSVRGEKTTVYDFAIEGATDSARQNEFNAFGDATGTVEVGKDGLLRRFVLEPKNETLDDPNSDEEIPNPERVTYEMWDYGVEVDVAVDESRVVDAGDPGARELMSQIFGAEFTNPESLEP